MKAWLIKNKYNILKLVVIGYALLVLGNIASNILNTYVQPDYNPLIERIQEIQAKEKDVLIDSISSYKDLIEKQSKTVDRIESKLKSQDKKLEQIKKDYDIKENNIRSLNADDVVSESTKQLSE